MRFALETQIRRIFLLSALAFASLFQSSLSAQEANFPPVTDEMLQNPADGDWLMWRRTLDSWGYSPLDEISKENVGDLRLVWTRNLAVGTGEITPLAYNGMLFVPQANDVIEAIDAETGDFIWGYRSCLLYTSPSPRDS